MKNFKKHKRLIIRGILLIFLVWGIVAGLIFLDIQKKQKISQKEIKECYENLKNEVVQLERQEKELKQQFSKNNQISEKGKIKKKLILVQKNLFDQKEKLRHHPYRSQFPEKGSKKRNKKAWANSIKEKLKKQLAELQNGTYKDPEYDGFSGDPIFQFYFARFELDEKDCQEISKIIGEINQIQEVIRVKEKREREEKLENNPNLFYCPSTRPDGNTFVEWKDMKGYISFGKVENGKHFRLMVPADHSALNNVLFNDGWGTNSEIGPWFEITGTENIPLERYPYSEVAEEFAWNKFVDYKDNITINYFSERERE